ncbi:MULTISPECIES: HEAT repeat domain-containing protein [Actinoplanes]|uniref:HEAT repeat domain-containing protein n=1 Tax=Actinoplanes TaxID=1865 RepID=UPI0005F2D626|nr:MULTISPECIES: HEAT repeat domain-containing protein [Actinoplanes]GLY02149.1 hypothetical protein Acsp01_25280 [Actinoplanes sp. NBRC 101535]
MRTDTDRALAALNAPDSSLRLKAALHLGSNPDPALAGALIDRSATEPDFFVRDMLTWALTRLPPAGTVPALLAELTSATPQARSQALHTLSKIGDRGVWPAITPALLHDPDDEVARAAWRTAVLLTPEEARAALAEELIRELARGDRDLRLSLSRALTALGDMIEPALRSAVSGPDEEVRAHATATLHLLRDPEAGFDLAVTAATRTVAFGPGSPAC